ncbi:hypothetical protein ET495_14510 [Xylanimonas allomyrinae]|uniref:DUF6318 domain-containing protein n=1 Tax=Xylanimonas allomyrinae TaxID=2509459 RepID=A0A4P6EP64_9MICO|nr:hypothetical protein ET495_14510 [Xylanimonas allomyrinae]
MVLSLTACSPDGDTSAASPAPAASSPAPTPSPTASRVVIKPARPAAMDDDGPAGAEAAARYFLELDSYMQATGDTTEWEAMSHQSCEFCAKRRDQARKIAERGDSFDGGHTAATILHTYQQDAPTGIWPIDVQTEEGSSRIMTSTGDVLWEQSAVRSQFRVEVARRDDAWVIVGVADKPKD